MVFVAFRLTLMANGTVNCRKASSLYVFMSRLSTGSAAEASVYSCRAPSAASRYAVGRPFFGMSCVLTNQEHCTDVAKISPHSGI